MSYTLGPWKWNDGYAGLIGSNGNPVLDHAPYEGMWLSHEGDREANARLIAAAPEMADLLETICAIDHMTIAGSHIKESARAILKRIKGES